MRTIHAIALTLVIVGALNWGLIGLFDFNLVAALFGEMTTVTRIVYALVGVSAVYEIFAVWALLEPARGGEPGTGQEPGGRARGHA